MKTSSHISNIGYLPAETSEVFFRQICETQPRVIPCVIWIAHKGEITQDEPDKRDKDHTHILLPSTGDLRNTDNFTRLWYTEFAGATAATPFWKKTKAIEDWLLYSVHNPNYLIHKGDDVKEFDYPWDAIQVTTKDGTHPITEDEYWMREVRLAKAALRKLGSLKGDVLMRYLIHAAKTGIPFETMLMDGIIPTNQYTQAFRQYDHMRNAVCSEPNIKLMPETAVN